MLDELGHKALAEPHDLAVGLALGVEVGAALAAAHGQGGEGILEDLLKAQEFDDGQVHVVTEAQAALVGADGGVELDTIATVDLDLALIVHPGHPEHNNALGLHNAADDVLLLVAGVGLHHRNQGLQHFVDGLQELGLLGVAGGQILINAVQVSILDGHKKHSFLFPK